MKYNKVLFKNNEEVNKKKNRLMVDKTHRKTKFKNYVFVETKSPSPKLVDAVKISSINALNFLSHEGTIKRDSFGEPRFNSLPYDDPLEEFYKEAGIEGNEDFLDGFGFAFMPEEVEKKNIKPTWKGFILCGKGEFLLSWDKVKYKWIHGPIGKTVAGKIRRIVNNELNNTWQLWLNKHIVCRGLVLNSVEEAIPKQKADFFAKRRRENIVATILEVVSSYIGVIGETFKKTSDYIFSWLDWSAESSRSTILERILLKKRKVRVSKTPRKEVSKGYHKKNFLVRPNKFYEKYFQRMLVKETI